MTSTDNVDTSVVLEVFDLSFGLTGHLSENILGTRVDGIFHTNVTVFGYSYFFSSKIQRMTSAEFQQMFGRPPLKTLACGTTTSTREEFETYLHTDAVSDRFSARNYNLLQNNCNDFSKACLTFLLPSTELSPDVTSVLNNANIILNSPNTLAARNAMHEGGAFLTRLLQTLGQNASLSNARNTNTETLTADLAITGLLDIVENLANTAVRASNSNRTPPVQTQTRTQERVRRQNSGTSQQLARNIFETFTTLASLLPAVQTLTASSQTQTEQRNRNILPPSVVSQRLNSNSGSESGGVELRAEVLELLETVFSEPDESIVLKTVRKVLQKEGYYSLDSLKGITEAALVELGVKKGWARKLKTAIDKYFNE